MGAVIGSSLPGTVLWASEGRSAQSRQRAVAAGLEDAGSVAALAAAADVILSVCPPEAALEVAAEVAATGFAGLYVDANAVSPGTARQIATRFKRFVDGGIVGPPPQRAGTTRLYLSGAEARSVAALFEASRAEPRIVGTEPGAASAVKMCFASWTKGTSALLLAIRALAEAEGVTAALLAEWETSKPDLAGRSEAVSSSTGPKAWRFEAEMREIASTFAEHDLPAGFHEAAAEVYRRLAPLKGAPNPVLADAVGLLLGHAVVLGQEPAAPA
jgi:3-hydroxyisobutyrate dehydrogenase-like beta-hydroxyacid dehydrogenase